MEVAEEGVNEGGREGEQVGGEHSELVCVGIVSSPQDGSEKASREECEE